MQRSPSIRKLIKDLEPDELREVILELSKLTTKNKQFLQLYLQSSDAVDVESIVKEAKKKIHGHFYGRSMFPIVDLSNARKAVNEYSKVLKEYPCQVADLKLYYIEVGTELTNDFGDMNEGFYSSLESMFEGFCKQIKKYPVYFNQFEDRIHELQSACQNIGWGYGDVIDDLVFELEDTVKTSQNT
jgi:predicted CopG family antitoxin